jgi:predicted flavoprotein YhiN
LTRKHWRATAIFPASSLDAEVTCHRGRFMKPYCSPITPGISGPAILQISSYWPNGSTASDPYQSAT